MEGLELEDGEINLDEIESEDGKQYTRGKEELNLEVEEPNTEGREELEI